MGIRHNDEVVDDVCPQKLRACAPMSFKDIAESLGITRQRAQQIYLTALRKARINAAKRGINIEEFFRD
jgi:DNA-directed RNA polymerase sigma subunit (sigma70/sigma32)